MVQSETAVIARREWRWVSVVIALALIASSLPILAGYLAQTDELRFAGAVYDTEDYFSHLAKIQLGARGEYRFRSLFTAEPHPSEPIIYTDILLGAIAGPLHIPLPLIYELSRLTGAIALLVMVYKFIARAIPEVALRRLAFIIAIVSSGLGWLFISSAWFSYPNVSPIDFWLADGYLMFSIMAFPHFGWSIAAMLGAFLAWQNYADDPCPQKLFWLIGLSTLLGLIQIFELALLDGVIALDALRRLRRDRPLLGPFITAALPMGLLQLLIVWPYLLATQNPLVQVWQSQSRTLSPSPLHYLVGYGLLWPLVGLGLWWAGRQRAGRLAFPAIWLAVVAVLVYSPNDIQYRWLEGLPVPLAIFAAIGLYDVFIPFLERRSPSLPSPRFRWWMMVLVVIATMPSTLYLIAGNTLLAASHRDKLFYTRGQLAAMDWLAENTQPDDTVLSSLKLSTAIPGWTGHRVFVGHWAETMFYTQKVDQVYAFFNEMSDDERKELLRQQNIRYVLFSLRERLISRLDPVPDYLTLQYQNDDAAIYEVRLDDGP